MAAVSSGVVRRRRGVRGFMVLWLSMPQMGRPGKVMAWEMISPVRISYVC